MPFIALSNGQELVLRYPRNGQLDIRTIAHSLAQINRFNGHALRPYSVAEHSLLVCEIAEREFRLDVHGLLAALMHDAHECVAGDMHSPGKADIGQPWKDWEGRWSRQLRSEWALHTAFHTHAAAIHHADLIALATERRDLLHPGSTTPWPVLAGITPVGWLSLNTPEREAMPWLAWAAAFRDRADALDFARNEALFGEPDSGFTL